MVRFEPIPEKNAEVLEAVMADIETLVDDESILFKVRLSTEEILENICNYSCSSFIQALPEVKDGMLSVEFRDSGVPFNPLEKDDPDITASVEDRQIGGLGIFLCKQMMDYVSYVYDNGINTFTMKIKLNQ